MGKTKEQLRLDADNRLAAMRVAEADLPLDGYYPMVKRKTRLCPNEACRVKEFFVGPNRTGFKQPEDQCPHCFLTGV